MNDITLFQLSSLEKVYLDYKLPDNEITQLSCLKNEKISYQIAYSANTPLARYDMKIKINSPISEFVSVRLVGNVPSEYPIRIEADEHYERYSAGMFPDVLYPIENDTIEILCGTWHSLWITVDLKGNISGTYPIEIELSGNHETISKTMTLEILDACLPKQDIIFTQWFHGDCIADFYKVPVFSERHWELMESFIKTACDNGINMMLTPIFTPPLDTEVGFERTTIQLIDIIKEENGYKFGFDKLKRWIKMCQDCGIEYFEMAHLFTQWGMKFTPKIIAKVNGEDKRIFGWDVASDSPEYMEFLKALLPELDKFSADMGIKDKTFYHISDEPSGEHIEKYVTLKAEIKKILPDITVMDALSDYKFYSEGVVDLPIPATNEIKPFIENNVPLLWSYYCCAQNLKVSNRFMAMPSYRNRVIGLQFYKFDVKGFLHWGYNFYNSALSKRKINPFMVTDAVNSFQSGDAFSVYPGEDGALESLRLLVFYDALQDLRALKLLESFIGKAEVIKLIEDMAETEIRFDNYPHARSFCLI